MTLKATPSVTSSPASVDGPTPSGLQDGLTTDLYAEIARLRAENARMRKALNVIAGSAARATLKETT